MCRCSAAVLPQPSIVSISARLASGTTTWWLALHAETGVDLPRLSRILLYLDLEPVGASPPERNHHEVAGGGFW